MDKRIIELRKILTSDPDIFKDMKRLDGLVADLFPDDMLTQNLIMQAYDIDIAKEMKTKQKLQQLDIVRYQLMLSGKFGLSEDNAIRAIRLWADILEIDDSALVKIAGKANPSSRNLPAEHGLTKKNTLEYAARMIYSDVTQEMKSYVTEQDIINKIEQALYKDGVLEPYQAFGYSYSITEKGKNLGFEQIYRRGSRTTGNTVESQIYYSDLDYIRDCVYRSYPQLSPNYRQPEPQQQPRPQYRYHYTEPEPRTSCEEQKPAEAPSPSSTSSATAAQGATKKPGKNKQAKPKKKKHHLRNIVIAGAAIYAIGKFGGNREALNSVSLPTASPTSVVAAEPNVDEKSPVESVTPQPAVPSQTPVTPSPAITPSEGKNVQAETEDAETYYEVGKSMMDNNAYDGTWVKVCDDFAMYLPTDWEKNQNKDANTYKASDPTESFKLTIQKIDISSWKTKNLDQMQAYLQKNGFSDAGQFETNGIPVLAYTDMTEDSYCLLLMPEAKSCYQITFYPQSNSEYTYIVADMILSINAAQA